MKIIRYRDPYAVPIAIQEFADKHHLVMEVHERSLAARQGSYPLPRYYAHFTHVEVHSPGILSGVAGNAETEDGAISDYATRISGKTITTDGGKTDIEVPVLLPFTNRTKYDQRPSHHRNQSKIPG